MKIDNKTYNLIKTTFNELSYETGGILGGYKGVITHFQEDLGRKSFDTGSYIPNIAWLNEHIKQWAGNSIQFYGIVHNHLTQTEKLSGEDKVYIEKIMKSMPAYINELYFPLVLPKGILVAFSAKIVENEIIIRKDNIFVKKIVKNR